VVGRAAAREMHVDLFQRFALMRYWRVTEGLPFSAFLSKKTPHERLELWLHR
jgi:hypothetical protein